MKGKSIMKITTKKIKEAGKNLGVKITLDKTLDKFSNLVPDKMKENDELLANTVFSF